MPDLIRSPIANANVTQQMANVPPVYGNRYISVYILIYGCRTPTKNVKKSIHPIALILSASAHNFGVGARQEQIIGEDENVTAAMPRQSAIANVICAPKTYDRQCQCHPSLCECRAGARQ